MDESVHFRSVRGRAYLFHSLLAALVCLVLVITISSFGQPPEVVGGGMFLLVMSFGLPIIFLFGGTLYYSYRARSDWHLILLSAVSLAMFVRWLAGIEPAVSAIVLDSLYVALTFLFALRWRLRTGRTTD